MAIEYKKYAVKIELEVTAEKDENVLKEAVSEIRELHAQGELKAKIKEKKEKGKDKDKKDLIQEYKNLIVKMALNNAKTKEIKRYRELEKIIIEKIN